MIDRSKQSHDGMLGGDACGCFHAVVDWLTWASRNARPLSRRDLVFSLAHRTGEAAQ